MDNNNMLKLCRLCLVKDDVNIPIFEEQGDIRQIFLKISSCLPVKVSRDDQLPKKICDGCSYKLDMLYEFWNTSANAEKQLLTWLGEAGMSSQMADGTISAVAQQIKPADAFVKQETIDPPDIHMDDDDDDDEEDKDYMKQEDNSNNVEEPPPKRARRTAAVKAAIALDQNSDDDDDSGEPMTKVEDDSEDSDNEDHEPAFVDVPSTSADDQPGPSGVGKDGVEAPKTLKKHYITKHEISRSCESIKSECEDEDYGYPAETTNIKLKQTHKKIKINKQSDDENEDDFEEYPDNDYTSTKTKKNLQKSTESRTKRSHVFKRWPCKKCDEICFTKKDLAAHRKENHIKEEPEEHTYQFDNIQELYICNTCSAEFTAEEEVKKHVKTHSEQYECTVCNQKFKKLYDFAIHNYTHDPEGLFRCPLCPYSTLRRTGFSVHINFTHLKKCNYVCETCGKGFNDMVLYKEHHNEHLGVKPFTCIVCSKIFTYSRYLLNHQLRSHRVGIIGQLLPNQCSICKKVFSKMSTLEKHFQDKHIKNNLPHDKRHLCDTCGKGFAQKTKLKIHYRVHTGFKPYTCSYCSKSFTKKDYLVMHERVHSGEKPYSCEYCGKCFSQGAPLRIHQRTHTGERPYVCQFCNTGFISKSALTMHYKNCTR
ncbi:zinc finger protein 287-like isoform X9 [Diorhabda carinulata]|uniref:zinc finger protein 287-like isoform X9 n=1 Tax=Diorhabda carinulata TaxID=1163345 RepID=UPI00259FFD5A|nr:zinc finger protein 287-like isoform X9 [Diorhabda carinulata]